MKTRKEFIHDALTSKTDECIIWPFAIRKSSGYAAHNYSRSGEKKSVDAHRYVCVLAHGEPSSPTLEASHSCGDKLCINPAHLRWATHKENMKDAIDHGNLKGGGRWRQRFFGPEVEHICASRKSILELADMYKSSPSYISEIRRRHLVALS